MAWTMHHGDCLEWMRSLPDKSVDHVITDPYSEHVHKNARSAANRLMGMGTIIRPTPGAAYLAVWTSVLTRRRVDRRRVF